MQQQKKSDKSQTSSQDLVKSKSPCKKECKLGEDRKSCEVCLRTIEEITECGIKNRQAKKDPCR